MLNLRKIYRALYKAVMEKLNKVKYARKIGVNMPGEGNTVHL